MPDSTFKRADLPQIRIVKTTPNVAKQQLFSYRRCYIGISIDNRDFYGLSLEALLRWAAENYEQCLIVVGDYLRRFNEQIFSGSTGESAEKVSFQAGDNYLKQTKEIFSRFNGQKIKLIRWKDCLEKEEYKKARKILDNLYTLDESFRAAVQKDAFSFIKRQNRKKQDLAVTMEEAIDISSQYLLEEVAVFSALAEEGWNIEVYPGPELGVLVEIAQGNFKDIPAGLKKRINIELRIDKT